MLTAANNHLTCLRELLEQGADVNAQQHVSTDFNSNSNLEGKSFLFIEVGMGEAFSLLLLCMTFHVAGWSCLPFLLQASGASALYYAAQNGHLEVVKWLVKLGADLNLPTHVRSFP